jgi:capsule polysaccharide export protein KpsC/LpsZ
MIDWNLVSSILEDLQNLQKIKRLKLDDDEKICWMIENTWQLAQKAEREACAKVCDDMEDKYWRSIEFEIEWTPVDCAAAIRARGQE